MFEPKDQSPGINLALLKVTPPYDQSKDLSSLRRPSEKEVQSGGREVGTGLTRKMKSMDGSEHRNWDEQTGASG